MKHLTRDEMKKIIGGQGALAEIGDTEACNCNSSDDCTSSQQCGADCTAGTTGKAGHCVAKG